MVHELKLISGRLYELLGDGPIGGYKYGSDLDLSKYRKDVDGTYQPRTYYADIPILQQQTWRYVHPGSFLLIVDEEVEPPLYLNEEHGKWGQAYYMEAGFTALVGEELLWFGTEHKPSLRSHFPEPWDVDWGEERNES